MKIEVAYKRIPTQIRLLFVKSNRFFMLIGPKLWVIDYAGRQFPDIDTHNVDIREVNTRGKLVFLITGAREIFTCRLGCDVLSGVPIQFSTIRFGKHILYSHRKSLFVLSDPAKALSERICSLNDEIDDVAYSNRRIFVIAATKALYARWEPGTTADASSFRPVGFLSGVPCKKLHINSMYIVIVETENYLISLLPNTPILTTKPSFYYDLSFTKYHAVFLAEHVLVVSLFSGSVEKIIRLTGFSSVFDTKTNKLWVYSNSLFEITIEEPASVLSKHLADQHLFKRAMRISQGSADVIEKYVIHLFEKNRPQKALRYFMLLKEPFYFPEKQLLENAQHGPGVLPVMFSCRFVKGVAVPEHIFLRFLFKKAVIDGEYVELLSRILFLRKKFELLGKLTRALPVKSAKIMHIEDINYGSCTPDERKAVDKYNMHRDPAKLVRQKLLDRKYTCARRVFVWAHRRQKIKSSEHNDLKLLLAHVKSKSITKIFARALGHECLSVMQENSAYTNLAYYVRFSEDIMEDMQQIFRMAERIPSKVRKRVLAALEKRLSPGGCFEPFLRTFEIIVSEGNEVQSKSKL